jgi:hypothetical protein
LDSEKSFIKKKESVYMILEKGVELLHSDWSTDSAHFFRFWEKYFENGLLILRKVFLKRKVKYT